MTSPEQKEEIARLVVQVQQGDLASFDELFVRTHKLARKISLSILGRDSSDDAIQESYILVFKKLPQLKEPEAFLGWLSRLVLHTCYRLQKKDRQNDPLPESGLESPDPTNRALDAIHLRQALNRLKREDRELLILREFLSLSYEEVAYALCIPLGTVKSRLSSARKNLKKRLEL